MFTSINFTLFFVASWILIVTPGPDMLYVIMRGITQGRAAGILSAMGVTLGLLVHTMFAALGLAVLLQTSAVAFSIVKYAGALYLIYLGVKAIRDKTSFTPGEREKDVSFRTIFFQGTLSNVLNPKVALFFLAFLPQFVNREHGQVPLQMIFLGLVFAFFGLIFLITVGYFSGKIGRWLFSQPSIADKLRWLTGTVLIGLGVRLAFAKRRS
jgi:threonine/homoserine/homoserine lactone efflux protein